MILMMHTYASNKKGEKDFQPEELKIVHNPKIIMIFREILQNIMNFKCHELNKETHSEGTLHVLSFQR